MWSYYHPLGLAGHIFYIPTGIRMATISPPLATNQTTASLPLSAVFQRLRQLKAWQQQQQETLLHQQQEQLLKLRNEQTYQRNQVSDTSVGSNERGQGNSPVQVHLAYLCIEFMLKIAKIHSVNVI